MTGSTPKRFDIAFLGSYTKDTIISAARTRFVDGGTFYHQPEAGLYLAGPRPDVRPLGWPSWWAITNHSTRSA